MAVQALGILSVNCQSVFEKALEMGMTKQGEMFSATALCQLANLYVKASLLDNALDNVQVILDLLNQGKLLLVP